MIQAQDEFVEYLRPGKFIDSDHPDVMAFSSRIADAETSPVGKAVALYYAVRDGFRYDPYHIDLGREAMRASALLTRDHGFCISKAALLSAAARHQGIPARLGFADVRNHLTTPKLRQAMGTDVFVWHGFAELLLSGRWIKATPAFDRALCERFRVAPLEFDGRRDAVFQEVDARGNRFMEYLADRGHYADIPLETLRVALEEAYPLVVVGGEWNLAGRFEEDVVADLGDGA